MNFATMRIVKFFPLIAVLAFCSNLDAQPVGGKWTECPQLPLLKSGHMVFADSMIGYYIGSDTGYVTKNGGVTWTMMTFPSNARPAPTFLFAPDHNTIISYQNRSTDSNGIVFPGIIKSIDMGSTWSLVDANPIPINVHAFKMWSATDGFRIWEDDITQLESCAVTHDGGQTFTDIRGDAILQKYTSQIPKGNTSIQMNWSDQLHGVIAVSSKNTAKAYPVLLTSDGGKNWSEHYMKYNGDSTISLASAYLYPGSNTVWVMPSTIQSKAITGYFFYYSTDFGSTWKMTDTVKSEFLFALQPVSPTATWVVVIGNYRSPSFTTNVIAYKDINGKWTYIDTVKGPSFVIPLTIIDIQFTDPYHGWVRAFFRPGTDTIHHDPFAHIFRFAASTPNIVPLNSANSHLRCVPNPASSVIKIDGFASDERIRDVKLSSTLGSRCSCSVENTGSAVELDVRNLPNGCYFVTISTSLGTENIPVMIVH